MAFETERWTRLEYDETAVYVDPDTPNWFVPNKAGDRVLQSLPAGTDVRRSAFLQRLSESPRATYRGREEHLQIHSLRELWLHVADRCSRNCTHCVFASGTHRREEMSIDRVRCYARETSRLGCRVFALTGGEPFVHPDFEAMVDELLELPDAAVAILTNGTLLKRYEPTLRRWRHRRFHLQVSVDGLAESHDAIRGPGAHAALTEQLKVLKRLGMAYTISVCVTRENVADLPALVDYCAEAAAVNLHLMWYFIRGQSAQGCRAQRGAARHPAGARFHRVAGIASLLPARPVAGPASRRGDFRRTASRSPESASVPTVSPGGGKRRVHRVRMPGRSSLEGSECGNRYSHRKCVMVFLSRLVTRAQDSGPPPPAKTIPTTQSGSGRFSFRKISCKKRSLRLSP